MPRRASPPQLRITAFLRATAAPYSSRQTAWPLPQRGWTESRGFNQAIALRHLRPTFRMQMFPFCRSGAVVGIPVGQQSDPTQG